MSEINEVKEKEMSEVNGGGGLGIQRKLTSARCRCGGRVYGWYFNGNYDFSACENGHKFGKRNRSEG